MGLPNLPVLDDSEAHAVLHLMLGPFGRLIGPRRMRTLLTDMVCDDDLWDAFDLMMEPMDASAMNMAEAATRAVRKRDSDDVD